MSGLTHDNSTTHSVIWSALFTLESIEQPADLSPPLPWRHNAEGHTAREPKDTIIKTITRRKAHEKVVSAIALIGTSSPGPRMVTACAIEVLPPTTPSGVYDITFRIAQNQTDPLRVQDQVSKLQSITDKLVQAIRVHPPSYWKVQEQRLQGIWTIANETLVPLVVEQCHEKLTAILSVPYSTHFVEWYNAKVSEAVPFSEIAGLEPGLCLKIHSMFWTIIHCQRDKHRTTDEMTRALFAAYEITKDHLEIFEEQWDAYSKKPTLEPIVDADEETLDDAQMLGKMEYQKNHIHRFLGKLARYIIASSRIIQELVTLYCSQVQFTVTIGSVPLNKHGPSCHPMDENEYSTFENFIKTEIHTDLQGLSGLRDQWAHAYQEQTLVVHAELQLALYYSVRPKAHPIKGFIGASQLSCFACDFVIKHLQAPYGGEDDDIGPIDFVFEGTHGQRQSRWLFPHPSMIKLDESVLNDPDWNERAKKVANRFESVRRDLQDTLVGKVKKVVLDRKKDDKALD